MRAFCADDNGRPKQWLQRFFVDIDITDNDGAETLRVRRKSAAILIVQIKLHDSSVAGLIVATKTLLEHFEVDGSY